jgi:hypothetical protein
MEGGGFHSKLVKAEGRHKLTNVVIPSFADEVRYDVIVIERMQFVARNGRWNVEPLAGESQSDTRYMICHEKQIRCSSRLAGHSVQPTATVPHRAMYRRSWSSKRRARAWYRTTTGTKQV